MVMMLQFAKEKSLLNVKEEWETRGKYFFPALKKNHDINCGWVLITVTVTLQPVKGWCQRKIAFLGKCSGIAKKLRNVPGRWVSATVTDHHPCKPCLVLGVCAVASQL